MKLPALCAPLAVSEIRVMSNVAGRD